MRPKMNMIPSKIEEIHKLQVWAIPSTPIDVVRLARVDNAVVAITATGRVYSSGVNMRTFWSNVNRLGNTVKALIKLGRLSQAAVDQHKAAEAVESLRNSEKWAAEAILENVAAAGITLTKAQVAELKAKTK